VPDRQGEVTDYSGLSRAQRAGLVSVVIPCYNQAHFLGEAIESVLAQRYTDFEVIVVDDGSTDNTSEVASRYEEVRLIRQQNRGLAGARNRGLGEARGEYVVFLDSDDRLLAKALEVGVRELESHPECAFVSGHYRPIDPSGASLAVPPRPDVGRDHYLSLLRENYIKMTASVVYRRWVFGEVGGFDGSVDAAADWDLYLRVARRFPVHHHNELVAEYRRHGATMSTDPALILRSTAAVLRTQREHVKGNKQYEKAYKAGMGALQEHNAVNLAKDIKSRARERQWAKAARDALALARYYPRGLPLLSEGHQERYRLAEELSNANRTIHARERQNRRLKKRNRRLALEAQSLDWQSRGVSGSGGVQQRTRFFVVGEMKSGTSWTMWMLNSHPEVFCSGEGCFFGRDQEREEIPVYGEPTPSLRNALLNFEDLRTWKSFSWNYWGNQRDVEEDLPDLTRLAVDYYMLQGSATSGKRIVGDKSPLHTDYVDEIFELYPEAKVIHVVRDGRDVAVSLMHHFWTLAKDTNSTSNRIAIYDLESEERAKRNAYREDPEGFLASGESIFVEERLRQIARRWSRRVGKASRDGSQLFGESFFQVSYEELLARPQENMKTIFELLGAQADDEVVGRCVEKNSFESMAKRPKGREDSGAFLRKGVAGDWRSVFTERDREIYEAVARDTLRAFGYLPS
jgi:glycosyltransferase involved in cell wall biosynthesis